MTRRDKREQGFTVVEVMVAVVLLMIGLLALIGSSATVTRMIGRGKTSTIAVQTATMRLERLRQLAGATTPRCTSASFKSDSTAVERGMSERWEVPANGTTRTVRAIVSYTAAGGVRRDTLTTTILCN